MALLLLLTWAAALYVFSRFSKRRLLPLPPGPPADPLIGHLRSMPAENQEDVFYRWGKQYGDVIHVHVLGKSIVILNSLQAAIDLLDKRSGIYSDRPAFPIFEIMGLAKGTGFMRYGKEFRRHRRMFQQHLSAAKCIAYQDDQTIETRALLQSILSNCKDREVHISRFSTTIIMKIAYGYQLTSDDDPFLSLAQTASEALHECGSAGGTPLDFFPFLKHLPSWFPGTYYADLARKKRKAITDMHRIPFEYVQAQLAKGTAAQSFVASELKERERLGPRHQNSDEEIMGVGMSMYVAGAETTWSTISTFIYAMLLHPQCQVRAQQEIDSVVCSERLPNFEDRKALPYVEAILQEVMRWHGSVPLGVPHRCTEDDVYRGMWIPKGSIVISNIRAINLDENVYSEPYAFNPSRFLARPAGNGEPFASDNEVFGFGRRICPGRHLAEGSVWIAIASILATFNIKRAVRDDGSEIVPDPNIPFRSGLASQPPIFECDIVPRNERARLLILGDSVQASK